MTDALTRAIQPGAVLTEADVEDIWRSHGFKTSAPFMLNHIIPTFRDKIRQRLEVAQDDRSLWRHQGALALLTELHQHITSQSALRET